MMTLRTMLVLFSLVTSGCTHQVSFVPKDVDFLSHVNILSPSILNANKEKYNGQTVYVKGSLFLSPVPSHNLDELEDDFEFLMPQQIDNRSSADVVAEKNGYRCLAIINPGGFFGRISVLHGAPVVLKGEFVADFYHPDSMIIDFGACTTRSFNNGLWIDMDDFKRRYPTVFSRR